MNVARRCLSRLFLTAVLLAAGASGCTSNALETEPVSLPVPFSGSLTADTEVLVSNGPALHQGILFGHPSGDQWELQTSSGRSVGVVTFHLDTASDPIEDSNGRASFTRIHGASGGSVPGKPAVGSKVLAALFIDGPEYKELPGGVFKTPLRCEGDVVCGDLSVVNLEALLPVTTLAGSFIVSTTQ